MAKLRRKLNLFLFVNKTFRRRHQLCRREQGGSNVQGAILAQWRRPYGVGALIFLVYAVVFFFRAFATTGFELGVETLNGVTPQQLDGLNPAIMAYITHLHVAIAGFIAATAIAAGSLAWYGVRDGLWWAWITAVIVPVVGLAVALPLHYMGHFDYNWVNHLGPIYLGTIIYVVGGVLALAGLTRATAVAAQARR